MKRVLSILFTVAFIVCMVSIASPTVLAKRVANGPSESGQDFIWFYNNSGSSCLYTGDPDSATTPVSGMTYNKATNTLTLTDADYPTHSLSINEMGDDFTINLVGNSALQSITVWGFGYGGSLTLSGTGTLVLNQNKNSSLKTKAPLFFEAEKSASSLTIEDSVGLTIIPTEDDGLTIQIRDTLYSKDVIIAPNLDSGDLLKNSKSCLIQREAGDLIAPYFYPCTPKSGSGYSPDLTYGANPTSSTTYDIYVLNYDEALDEILAQVLTDDQGRSISSDLFDIDNDNSKGANYLAVLWYLPMDVYHYVGNDPQYANKEYTYFPSYSNGTDDPPVYQVFEIVESSTAGYVLMPVEPLWTNSEPEFLEPAFDDVILYDYDYYGLYTQNITESLTPHLKKIGDKWYYYNNGIKTKATLLFKHTDGKYYYVKNGVVTKSTLLFKHTDGKWYYIKNGVVTKDTLLFKHTDGKFYYIKNGVKTNATLLFKHTDGKWYYVKNGVVTKSTLLFKHTDGKYYYIKNGVMTKSTLLFKHTDGKYYYIKNGVVTKSTLLFKHTDGKYYYIKNGVMTKSTLLYTFNGKKRYVKAGVWQSGFSGKVKISGKTYTIKKGNVV
ncbi:MAG: hypothetical protein J6Z00_00545 [Clostridia bacterium]|nr:hypothetical protein [Clostridia bacterium]